MRVLVTGATGFLGSHLVDALVEAGHDVRALVRASSNTTSLASRPVSLVAGSLSSPDSLVRAVRGVDAVIHAAGGGRVLRTDDLYEQNTEATRALLAATLRAAPSLARFVFISSFAARGPTASDGLPGPVSAYGKSKLAAEAALLAERDRLPVTILRPPAIYGPGDDRWLSLFRAVKRGLLPLFGGRGPQSMVFGPDCARAACAAIERPLPSGQIHEVVEPRALSWLEIGLQIARVLGTSPVVVRLPDAALRGLGWVGEAAALLRQRPSFLSRDKVADALQERWVGSSDSLRLALGWQPRVTFSDDGAALTARWYESAGWL